MHSEAAYILWNLHQGRKAHGEVVLSKVKFSSSVKINLEGLGALFLLAVIHEALGKRNHVD